MPKAQILWKRGTDYMERNNRNILIHSELRQHSSNVKVSSAKSFEYGVSPTSASIRGFGRFLYGDNA